MTVLGIDIGNAFCVVAAAGKGGVDVILNGESKRETPTCVALGTLQRFLGAAAASPPPGTTAVSQIKRLIGRPLDDAGLKRDLETLFPGITTTDDGQGYPLLHFTYRGNVEKLSPTQLLGMLLGNLKCSAERHLSAPVSDCCIAVPAYFNHIQRLAVLHAASIAGLHPLRLLHECSATALEYGIYRGDLPANRKEGQHVAAFVDVGHSATQVAIAIFHGAEVRIVARAADPNLGGRDFDEALFDHFARKFKEEDIDVSTSPRAAGRLRTACEKLKKVLSANPEASLHIDCFVEDRDASGVITREEFEMICKPLLDRLKRPLRKALRVASMKPKSVEAVELIGSGSRVPAVVQVVGEVFEKEPRRTLNAKECVARGCALQAAMLSPAYKVKEFKIHEHLPFTVDISWNDSISEECSSHKVTTEGKFPTKNDGCTSSIKENGFSFNLQCGYTTASEMINAFSTYRVGPFHFTRNGNVKLKIAFKSTSDGIVLIDSVNMLPGKGSSKSREELSDDGSSMKMDESGVAVDKHEKKDNVSTVDDSPRIPENGDDSGEISVKMMKRTLIGPSELNQDGTAELKLAFKSSRNGIVLSTDPDVMSQGENESSNITEVSDTSTGSSRTRGNGRAHNNNVKKDNKLVNRNNAGSALLKQDEIKVQFCELIDGVLSAESLEKAKELENEMTASDKEVENTKSRKNELESYVYETRNKLRGKYRDYVSDSDKKTIDEKLQQTETWLYEEGIDVNSDSYIGKLDELKVLGAPIEMRYRESLEWQPALDRLVSCIADLVALADGKTPESTHIDKQRKEMIRRKCKQVEWWLNDVLDKQAARPKHLDPAAKVSDINSKIDHLTELQKWHTTAGCEEVARLRVTLDSYVYEMMGKLHGGRYGAFVSDTDKSSFFLKLKQSEKWILESGEVDCSAYISRLNDLKSLGDPIERRLRESLDRGPALEELNRLIGDVGSKLDGTKIPEDASMDKHHTLAEIRHEHTETAKWFSWAVEELNLQRSNDDPIVTVTHIQEHTYHLEQSLKRYHELIQAIQPKSSMINMIRDAVLAIMEMVWPGDFKCSQIKKLHKEVHPPHPRYDSGHPPPSENIYGGEDLQLWQQGSDDKYTRPNGDQMPPSSTIRMQPMDGGVQPYQLHPGQKTDLTQAIYDEYTDGVVKPYQLHPQPNQLHPGQQIHPASAIQPYPGQQTNPAQPIYTDCTHPGAQLSFQDNDIFRPNQAAGYPTSSGLQNYNQIQHQGYSIGSYKYDAIAHSNSGSYMTSSDPYNQGSVVFHSDQGRHIANQGQHQRQMSSSMQPAGLIQPSHYQVDTAQPPPNQYVSPQFSNQATPPNAFPSTRNQTNAPAPNNNKKNKLQKAASSFFHHKNDGKW